MCGRFRWKRARATRRAEGERRPLPTRFPSTRQTESNHAPLDPDVGPVGLHAARAVHDGATEAWGPTNDHGASIARLAHEFVTAEVPGHPARVAVDHRTIDVLIDEVGQWVTRDDVVLSESILMAVVGCRLHGKPRHIDVLRRIVESADVGVQRAPRQQGAG